MNTFPEIYPVCIAQTSFPATAFVLARKLSSDLKADEVKWISESEKFWNFKEFQDFGFLSSINPKSTNQIQFYKTIS